MANSGSSNTSAYEVRYLTFEWSVASQQVASNQTVINWKLRGNGGNPNIWYMSGNFKLIIDGSTVYQSATRIQLTGTKTVATGTHTLTHNGDGTKRFSASCEAGIYYYAVNCSGSGSFELPTISRATQPTVNKTSLSYGDTVVISLPRASSYFTHVIQASVDGKLTWTNLTINAGSSFTWTVPKSWARYLPNSTDRIRIRVHTYSGITFIGTKEISGNLQITPTADMTPVVSIALTDAMNYKNTYGGFVKGQSKIKAKVSERLYENTTVSSRTLVLNGVTYQSADQISEVLSSTSQRVEASVTDARGLTGRFSISPTVYDWYSPRITSFNVSRCNASGILDEVGNYIKVEYVVHVASVNNKNRKTLRCGYKRQSSSSWSYQNIDMTSFSKSGHIILSASGEYSWDVKLELADAFQTTVISKQIGTAYVLLDFHQSGKGIAVGKVSESQRVFELATDWSFKYKNNMLADFVIEQGITNEWIWRKWNSGIAECFKKLAIKTNVKNIWGSMYSSGDLSVTNLTYPFEFVDVSIVSVTTSCNGGVGVLMAAGGSYRATKTTTGSFEICRGTQAENAYYFLNYHVIGKWKN